VVKQTNLELERKDGIKRHFRYDWQEVAKYNPDYLAYVEAEKERLGGNHPLFLTQYCLSPIHGGGGFLNQQHKAQLAGKHSRKYRADSKNVYIAGIDSAGEAEEEIKTTLKVVKTRQDSTVVTIGELDFSATDELQKQPRLNIVEHYWWTGKEHCRLYSHLMDILSNVWHFRRVVIDATGLGQPVSSFLKKSLGSSILPFTFTTQSKSHLGFNLLAAINSGGLKMYAGEGSAEYREFWFEMERAKSQCRPNKTMNFYVDPGEGHDDFLMSMALLVEASQKYSPSSARGSYRL